MARIVFDLDGTLVDSVPSLAAAANALLAELGRDPLPPAQVMGFVGNGISKLVERVLAATGGVPDVGHEACLARYREIYFADPVTGTEAYAGVRDALAALAADGHGLAVCTQKSNAPAEAILTALDLPVATASMS